MCRLRLERAFKGDASYRAQPIRDDGVGACLNDTCDLPVCGTARGRIVFETSICRGIVRGCDDYTIRRDARVRAVETEDGMRDNRCGGVTHAFLEHNFDAVGGKDLDCSYQSRL